MIQWRHRRDCESGSLDARVRFINLRQAAEAATPDARRPAARRASGIGRRDGENGSCREDAGMIDAGRITRRNILRVGLTTAGR